MTTDYEDYNVKSVVEIVLQDIALLTDHEWQAYQGSDKNLYGTAVIGGGGAVNLIDYTIPAGKVLYIDDFVVSGRQEGISQLNVAGSVLISVYFIDDSAVPITFTIPKVAEAGEQVIVVVQNLSAAAAGFYATLGGREVDA